MGRELVAIGRPIALHHAEKIAGENRKLLEPKLGIYQYDELTLLTRTSVPAVLLEVGVIVDPGEEAYLRQLSNKKEIAQAITAAVLGYLRQ